MTSPYNEKVNKLNTALENVYLKKADLVDELSDILDSMIDSETPITVNINASSDISTEVKISEIRLINYKTSDVYDTINQYETSHHTMTYTNDIISFEMPTQLSFEDSALLIVMVYMGQTFYTTHYLYELEDADNNKIINVNMNDLPTSPPNE